MKFIFRLLIFAFVFLLVYKWPESVFSLDAQNPAVNKQIGSILLMQTKIQNGIKNRVLKKKRKNIDYCQGNISEKEIYQDSNGKIRKYRQRGSSDDSAVTEEYYYDEEGRLRLIFYDYGSVRGESLEQRIFIDERKNIMRVNYQRDFENKESKVNEHEKKVLNKPVETYGNIDYVWKPLEEFKKKLNCND
jgi:hypothetical protein